MERWDVKEREGDHEDCNDYNDCKDCNPDPEIALDFTDELITNAIAVKVLQSVDVKGVGFYKKLRGKGFFLHKRNKTRFEKYAEEAVEKGIVFL